MNDIETIRERLREEVQNAKDEAKSFFGDRWSDGYLVGISYAFEIVESVIKNANSQQPQSKFDAVIEAIENGNPLPLDLESEEGLVRHNYP